MGKVRNSLETGWQWRLADDNGCSHALSRPELREWSTTSGFPSVIHMELIEAEHIPDPNIGQNERLVQWVGECDWEYRCFFPTPRDTSAFDHVDLLFEGLDTIATVRVNGKVLGDSDNMFIPLRIDVRDALVPLGYDGLNEVHITFQSALKWGAIQEEALGKRKLLIRDPRRMYTRKVQVRLRSALHGGRY